MKLKRLRINEFRGIRNLDIFINSKTTLVYGGNGTGKSGIVDALDFIFSGNIERICGEGTQGITLAKHGRHIGCMDSSLSYVECEFYIEKIGDVVVKRSVKCPGEVVISPDSQRVRDVFERASCASFILTRRQILRYIHATPKGRQDSVSQLLNLQDIDTIRATFGTVRNSAKKQASAHQQSFNAQFARWTGEFEKLGVDHKNYKVVINGLRKELGGVELEDFSSKDYVCGIQGPNADPYNTGLTRKSVADSVAHLMEGITADKVESIFVLERAVRERAAIFQGSSGSQYGGEKIKILTAALPILAEEKGRCPLCDVEWNHDELVAHIKDKQVSLSVIADAINSITVSGKVVISSLTQLIARVVTLKDLAKKLELYSVIDFFAVWEQGLGRVVGWHSSPPSDYSNNVYAIEQIKEIIAPEGYVESVDLLVAKAHEKLPELTPLQEKWGFLNRIQEIGRACSVAKAQWSVSLMVEKRADALYASCVNSRGRILDDVYSSISDRFDRLYTAIHSDEVNFRSKISSSAAGMDFQVDFYGKGEHPPNALHSEGHQDSMGLCLYLALAEHAPVNPLGLVVLDDVVTSIDVAHRRDICMLLRDEFKHIQFLITTHDAVWSRHLKSILGIGSDNAIEFYGWSVDTGPAQRGVEDFIDSARQKILNNDINSAAHELRRGLEMFFLMACVNLYAKAPIRIAQDWSLGEIADPAATTLKNRLQEAFKHALNDESREFLGGLKDELAVAVRESKMEQWQLNPLVHYNEWANFAKEDFIPVVDAFEKLVRCFVCARCDSNFTYDHYLHELRCGCRIYVAR